MIEVRDLTKHYGDTVAVDRVSFEVDRGEIVGFVGCNGAGKTTTMRILSAFAAASSGDAWMGGFHTFRDSRDVRRIVGYLPESTPLYAGMRVWEYLLFRARLKGVPACRRKRQVATCAGRCGLDAVRRRVIGQLSKGFRQRVGLADALLGDPAILILDEPTVGLDPIQVRGTRELIREIGETRTVLLSTHILSEVERICDRTIIIDHGRIVADAPTADLRRATGEDGRLEDVFIRLAAGQGAEAELPAAGEPRQEALVVTPERVVEKTDDEEEDEWSATGAAERERLGDSVRRTDPADTAIESRNPKTQRREPGTGNRKPRTEDRAPSAPAPPATPRSPLPVLHCRPRSPVPALVRRELAAFFVSPIAYVVLTVFLVVAGLDFAFNHFSAESGRFAYGAVVALLGDLSVMVLFLVPLLTMRTLSEEISTGTIETLMTAPVSNLAVVASKFLGAFCFFGVMLVPTLAFPAMLYVLGGAARPDTGPMVSGYFGLLLLGGAAIAVGVCVSACVRNQISAAVGTTLVLALLWAAGAATAERATSGLGQAVRYLGILYHYESFAKGLIDTRDVVYFVTLAALFLFAAVGVVAVRRWR
jgi:ABC-2 type transport system ATP-binding protein